MFVKGRLRAVVGLYDFEPTTLRAEVKLRRVFQLEHFAITDVYVHYR